MKKVNSFIMLFVAVAMILGLSNCKKDNLEENLPTYLEVVDGSFIADDGDISFKGAPVAVNRRWSMYQYTNMDYRLIDGTEFVTGSKAWQFWSVASNNPITFPANVSVYSNLTPCTDIRLISETLDADGKVAYLGMLDLNPVTMFPQFPCTVKGYRLGDVLTINTDALTSLPGGMDLDITFEYNLAEVDLPATMEFLPWGVAFDWSKIVYKTAAPLTKTAGPGNFVVYEGLDSKVVGSIKITIVIDNNTSATPYTTTIQAPGAGKGMNVVLTTTRIGWHDSATINISDEDIQIQTEYFPIN